MWRENARKTKDPLFEFWRALFLSPFSNLNFTEEFISRFQTLSSFALIQKQVSERAQDDVKLEIEMERESNDLPPSVRNEIIASRSAVVVITIFYLYNRFDTNIDFTIAEWYRPHTRGASACYYSFSFLARRVKQQVIN